MYTLDVDQASGRISVAFTGFLTLNDVQRFVGEIVGHVRALRILGRQQTMFYDYSEAAIQSQDVVAALRDLARSNRLQSKRVALYTSGRLATMQAKRIAATHAHFAVFDDRAAAIEWLDAA